MFLDTSFVTPETEADWLAERRNSVGSSESPAILGVSTFATPIDVWQRKLGLAPDQDENDAMRWGKKLEPLILEEYTARTGRTVAAVQQFVRHPGYPWMTATLDGLTTDGRIVEVKTTSSWAREWGDEDTDAIPEAYLVQVHHQMACTGIAEADVAVLIGGQKFRTYRVERNAGLIEVIEARCAEFWTCVREKTPPDWGRMDARTLAVLYPGCEGEVDLDDGAAQFVAHYEDWGDKIKSLEFCREEMKGRVLQLMGNHQFGRLPDGRIVKRFLQDVAASSRVVNVKAHVRNYFKVLKGDA